MTSPRLGIERHSRHVLAAHQVANQHELRLREERHLHDAEPSHLDLSGDGRRRRGDKRPVGVRRDQDLIVGHETRLKRAVARQAP